MSKAAHATIPRGVHAKGIPCMDEDEAKALLEQYENSGGPDIRRSF